MNCIRIQQIDLFKFWSCSSKATTNGMPVILLEFFVHSSAKESSGTSDQNPPVGDVNFLLKGEEGRKRIMYCVAFMKKKKIIPYTVQSKRNYSLGNNFSCFQVIVSKMPFLPKMGLNTNFLPDS